MIIMDEINGEIAKLESQVQTYQTIEKLAALYTVRDHNRFQEQVPSIGGSEFLDKCNNKPVCAILKVVDELLSTLHAIQPNLYDAVMQKFDNT